ncbi:MAG: hypothetical protein OEY97_08595 [Nitrospirota bacterium]|nr:hypothetical protein [Nitrospirota bacterium]
MSTNTPPSSNRGNDNSAPKAPAAPDQLPLENSAGVPFDPSEIDLGGPSEPAAPAAPASSAAPGGVGDIQLGNPTPGAHRPAPGGLENFQLGNQTPEPEPQPARPPAGTPQAGGGPAKPASPQSPPVGGSPLPGGIGAPRPAQAGGGPAAGGNPLRPSGGGPAAGGNPLRPSGGGPAAGGNPLRPSGGGPAAGGNPLRPQGGGVATPTAPGIKEEKVIGGSVHKKLSASGMTPEERLKAVMSSMAQTKRRNSKLLLVIPVILFTLLVTDLLFFQYGTYPDPVLTTQSHMIPGPVMADLPWPGDGADTRPAVRQGAAYSMLMGVVAGALGDPVAMGRIVNALLHAATGLMLFLLATRIASFAMGVTALAMFALYPAFNYLSSQLLAENLAVFLVTLTGWLGSYLARPERRWHTMGAASGMGLALFVLALTRPGLAPLAVLLTVAMAMLLLSRFKRDRKREQLGALVLGLALFLAPLAVWQMHVTALFAADGFVFSPGGPVTSGGLIAAAHDPAMEGWPHPVAETGSVDAYTAPPLLQSITGDPLGSALLLAEKVYRLWASPMGASSIPAPFHWWTGLLHLAVLGLAVVGVARMQMRPTLPYLLLPVAYVGLVYPFAWSEERRFAIVAMPMVILLASISLRYLWLPLKERLWPIRRLRPSRAELGSVLLFAGAAYVALMGDGFVLYDSVSPWLTHAAIVGVLSVAILSATWWVAGGVHREDPGRRAAATGLMLFLLLGPMVVHQLWFADWHAFSVTLKREGQRVEQVFTLPAGMDLSTARAVTVQIDVRDRDGSADNLVLQVDGVPSGTLVPMVDTPAYRQVAVGEHKELLPGEQQWLVYRLDPRKLAGKSRLNVSLGMAGNADWSQRTEVFGDLPHGDPKRTQGPAPWIVPEDRALVGSSPANGRASLWRHATYGDMRLRGVTWLGGQRLSQYVSDAGQPSDTSDLSPALYLQPGAYRIHLQVILDNGAEVIL